MSKEAWILLTIWVLLPPALWRLTPKSRVREMHIVFIFLQTFTWLFDILVVQFDLIEYPFREFPNASRIGFTLHFLLYPALGVFYMLWYPKTKPKWWQTLYSILWSAGVSIVAWLIPHTTQLAHHVRWSWLLSFETILFCNVLTLLVVIWFFKEEVTPHK